MIDLPVTTRTPDGRVGRYDLTLRSSPEAWTMHDAKDALWAMQRLLGAHVLYALRIVDGESGLTHRLEGEADTGTVATPALRLSSLALVWLQSAAFELPQPSRLQ